MPDQLLAYRVFIASPSGLETERNAFRTRLHKHNEDDATQRGLHFFPVGWELTLGGAKRPQALINQEVRRSDYFVLLLWDRWGSEPGDPRYTSGTEEEYHIALEALHDPESPMRDIVVFFKSVDARQLSDAGANLQKVLEFRKKIESEKRLLYHQFDNVDGFADYLHKFLAHWTREHEAGSSKNQLRPGTKDFYQFSNISHLVSQVHIEHHPVRSDEVQMAEQAAAEGHYTEAEIHFAKAISSDTDISALYSYGNYLQKMDRLQHAEQMFTKVIDLARQTGSDHWEADGQNNLARLYFKQGRYDEADDLYRATLRICERDLQEDPIRTASVLASWGLLLLRRDKFEDAEQRIQRALTLLRKKLGDDHEDTITVMKALAEVRLHEGNYSEAEEVFKQVLDKRRKLFGPDNPRVASVLSISGELYRDLAQFDKARVSFDEADRIREAMFGPDHRSIAWGLNGRAELQRSLGNYAEATILFERALHIREAKLGYEHPYVARTLAGLAEVRMDVADYLIAERYFRGAISIHKTHPDSRVSNLARSYCGLGEVYMHEGRLNEAEASCGTALDIRRKSLIMDHPNFAFPLTCLGAILIAQGNFVRAVDYLERAAYIRERSFGETHPLTADTLANLASARGLVGDTQVGIDDLSKVKHTYLRYFPFQHLQIARVYRRIAELYIKCGLCDQALVELTESKQHLKKANLNVHPELYFILELRTLCLRKRHETARAEASTRELTKISKGLEEHGVIVAELSSPLKFMLDLDKSN